MAAEAILPRRRFASVRSRTTIIASALLLLGLTAAAAAFVAFQHRQLIGRVDIDLAMQAEAVVAAGERGQPPLGPGPPIPPGPGDDLWQIIDADGNVVASSARAESDEPLVSVSEARFGYITTAIEDLGSIRVYVESLDGGETVVVAASLARVDDADATLRRSLLAGVPLLTLALGAVVWVVVGRALRPVDEIRRTVDEITDAELHRRVPEPHSGDEVAELATTMNSMLARLEAAAERQRRFVGDASHELRSPLTGMRALLEVDQYGSWETTRQEVLAEVVRMQDLVANLLEVARLEGGPAPAPHVAVDLDQVVMTEVQRVRVGTEVEVDVSGVSGAQVMGNAMQLAQVVANLLSNAVRHATARVTVVLAEGEDLVRLQVADDGPGIPPEETAGIFERFARLDQGRSRDRGGAGLGLAICASLVEAHGGSIRVEPVTPSGARFVVELPAPG